MLYVQVLELGMNFLTADDMIAILAIKLRKRLGFGMWAKLHMTGMHVEGKVHLLLAEVVYLIMHKKVVVGTASNVKKIHLLFA